ncbi:MAG: WecB/TagA/CpsF family glycosyltransferase [Planctomycetota bacterium]
MQGIIEQRRAHGSEPPPAPLAPVAGRSLFGVRLDALTLQDAVRRILALARTPGPHLVMTPNVDHVLRARRDPEFAAACRMGSLVVADGLPLVWAARLLRRPLPERVAGSDLMPASAVAAAEQGLHFFLLGGAPGDAERTRQVIAERAGRDRCCGVECPPFGFENDASYMEALLQRINRASPDILYVGLGSPKQERLMMALRGRANVHVMMAVGVTFSFVAGTVRRAPPLVQRSGFEWLWRLCCEPRRLWRRYVGNLAVFPWLVLREWLAVTLRRHRPGP